METWTCDQHVYMLKTCQRWSKSETSPMKSTAPLKRALPAKA